MRQRVTALIIRDKKILLVQEAGYCYTPGGGVEEGESHDEAIARECIEEIAGTVLASQPYFTYDCITLHSHTPQRNYCYFVEIQGEPCASNEIEGIFWLSYEELRTREDIIPYEQEYIFDRLKEEGFL